VARLIARLARTLTGCISTRRSKRLRERDGLTCRELAVAIDRLDLFRQSDGESPPSNQVSARVSNHREMFERRDGRVFLRQP
jgi:hypothetical protein